MIPFNQPVHLGTELAFLEEAIVKNGHVSGGGPFGRRCEEVLEGTLHQRSLVVTSCTHALEMAAELVGIRAGDEVIIPSFTFVSTANAFVLRGARIVFADVDAGGNIDLGDVERLLSPRTRCVVPVHYAGNSCDMPRLLELCDKVPVIEDAAQALEAAWEGKPLGTFGVCGAFSFHETKNVGCGEGGALTVRGAAFAERAEILRDKGTNRRRFMQGLVDKYTWVDVGSSWVLSDLNAAYLAAQLAELPRIQARRKAIHDRYRAQLGPAAERAGASLLAEDRRNTPNHHLFALIFAAAEQRTRFIAHMRQHGILTPFHYVPLHLAPMGQRFTDGHPLPNSERLGACLVRLPLFFNLTDAQQDEVIGRAEEFLRGL